MKSVLVAFSLCVSKPSFGYECRIFTKRQKTSDIFSRVRLPKFDPDTPGSHFFPFNGFENKAGFMLLRQRSVEKLRAFQGTIFDMETLGTSVNGTVIVYVRIEVTHGKGRTSQVIFFTEADYINAFNPPVIVNPLPQIVVAMPDVQRRGALNSYTYYRDKERVNSISVIGEPLTGEVMRDVFFPDYSGKPETEISIYGLQPSVDLFLKGS